MCWNQSCQTCDAERLDMKILIEGMERGVLLAEKQVGRQWLSAVQVKLVCLL